MERVAYNQSYPPRPRYMATSGLPEATAVSSSPSVAAIITDPAPSPVTFTVVRIISKIRSMPVQENIMNCLLFLQGICYGLLDYATIGQ